MKPPISYYGGKQSMLKDILVLVPLHDLYTEVLVLIYISTLENHRKAGVGKSSNQK